MREVRRGVPSIVTRIGVEMISLSSRDFTVSGDTMVAEASDLQDKISQFTGQQFQMVSERTGRVVTFRYAETQKDAEGDVQAWVFRPAVHIGRDVKVVIFND